MAQEDVDVSEKVLQLENIHKIFPGVKALDGVSFDLEKGEVHILLGENGAGKSTLMKILAGVYQANEGKVLVKGEEVTFTNTKQAQDKHIAIIYQEFNLIPNLTVAQNIFLGREPRKKSGLVDKAKLKQKAKEILTFLEADISVDMLVDELGVAQQQLVEVAKALSIDAEILIMDEPTATLSEKEIETLFKTIANLQKNGVSIIYISHRLQEIHQIGTRVTVIRDGCTIGTKSAVDTKLDDLITMMVGREISKERIRGVNTALSKECLRVRHINSGRKLQDISIDIKQGEIVGFAGLVGSGRTELANAIFGIDKMEGGEVFLFGKKMKKLSPVECIKAGMGFIPENRKEDGLALTLPIRENVVQASLKLLFRNGYINSGIEKEKARQYCQDLKVNTKDIERWVVNLSGGNQQKVVLAKWLCTHSKFLVFDEPTRGIDVGAKEEIHNLITDLAKSGVGIMMISSDLPEVLTLSDRIYVMREGKIVKELPGEGATQEAVIGFAAGKVVDDGQ